MMNQAAAEQLLEKYQLGTISTEELMELEAWFESLAEQHIDFPEGMQMEYADRLKAKIDHATGMQPVKVVSMWKRAVAVAAAVATVTLGVWLYYASSLTSLSSRIEGRDLYTNDIAPGKNTAMLTLANGKVINLDTNKTSVVVADSVKSITMLTASTPRGGTYQVVLPDGTKAWLNAASSITFPSSFIGNKERRITMTGEVYFEVAKDKAHPFVVEGAGQQVEVLGTEFNINAYADEPSVSTTLLKGSVRLVAAKAEKVLTPGQVAENQDGLVKVSAANLEAITDWKNEEFFLDKMDFRMAMRKLARWYDIEVIYSGSVPENLEAGGWIPRNSKLSDVLKAIEASGLASFKLEGRKLYVSK